MDIYRYTADIVKHIINQYHIVNRYRRRKKRKKKIGTTSPYSSH